MKPLMLLLFAVLILSNLAAFSETKNKLDVRYSDGYADSYKLDLDSGKTHLLSQSHSWVRDDFSRYNLVGYSIDGGDVIPIERTPRGDFTVEIHMDEDHSVEFFAVVQYPLVPTGISHYTFDPPSPTHDEWFDVNTSTKITFPGIVPTSDDTRQVLLRWVLDNSEVHLVKEGSPELSTNTVNMAGSHKIEFFSKTQFRVDVLSDFGESYGSGWYDKGSLASFGVKTDGVFGNTFDGWEGQGVELAENPAAILVDSPKKITAKWTGNYQNIAIYLIAGIAAMVVVVYAKRAKTAKVRSPSKDQVFAPVSGEPGQYDSSVSTFLEKMAVEQIDLYLSEGLVDQERHSRLKEAFSKNQ